VEGVPRQAQIARQVTALILRDEFGISLRRQQWRGPLWQMASRIPPVQPDFLAARAWRELLLRHRISRETLRITTPRTLHRSLNSQIWWWRRSTLPEPNYRKRDAS